MASSLLIFGHCYVFTKVVAHPFMRSFFLATFCCIIGLKSFAQVGNEWINFSQSYYKIPIAREGVYKLDYNALQAAGFPVGSVDPKKIQLFHRGVEQHIFVDGENDLQFDPTDFIEFYGNKNDGT